MKSTHPLSACKNRRCLAFQFVQNDGRDPRCLFGSEIVSIVRFDNKSCCLPGSWVAHVQALAALAGMEGFGKL